MRKPIAAALMVLVPVLVAADATNQTCEIIPGLPPCVQPCLQTYENSPDCLWAKRDFCVSTNDEAASCYESHCDLGAYLVAMNTTNNVCHIAPRDRKGTQVAVGSTFIAITTLVFALRLMGRPPWSGAFGIDDVTSLFGYFLSLVVTIMMLIGPQYGWGIDMWALGVSDIIHAMRIFYIAIVLFYAAASVTKLAVLFFYLRIFTDQLFRRVTYVMIVVCAAFGIAACFQTAFHCLPASFFWTRYQPSKYHGACQPDSALRVMPAINVVLDGLVMLLPLPSIVKLNLPLHKKLRVLSMFCVGILVITASVIRLGYLYATIKTYNITYNGAQISWFGVIECDVSVICTCMPPIALLLKKCSQGRQKSSAGETPGYQNRTSSGMHSYGSRRALRTDAVDSVESAPVDDNGEIALADTTRGQHCSEQPGKCLTFLLN